MKKASLLIGLCLVLAAPLASAQGTAFTYQGRLNNGTNPANGNFELTFALFSVSSGAGQIGSTITNSAVGISNGLFTVALDFGANFPGANRWLEIGVRSNGVASFTTLTPRQKLTAAPYAITASNLTGMLPVTQLTGTLASAQLGGTYSAAITLNNAGNSFSGSGAGLTGVNALTLAGYDYCSLPCYWKLTGNGGTAADVNFLGTTDFQGVTLRVNNTVALRLVPSGSTPQFIGGHISNRMTLPDIYGGTIGGGGDGSNPNRVSDDFSTIAGGQGNTAGNTNGAYTDASHAFVGGGLNNGAVYQYSAVVGGARNLANSVGSVVGGGIDNKLTSSDYGTVGGGRNHSLGFDGVGTAARYGAIGGGFSNSVYAPYSTVAGGRNHTIFGGGFQGDEGAAIGGGVGNRMNGSAGGTIAGGQGNIIDGLCGWGAIGGGQSNRNSGRWSFLGGGFGNYIWGDCDGGFGGAYEVIGGGYSNSITVFTRGSGNTIGGGLNNKINGNNGDVQPGMDGGTIGGGYGNVVSNRYGTIAGGISNIVLGAGSSIGGGSNNVTTASSSTIGGGNGNRASSQNSTVAGGLGNFAGSEAATIGGGLWNTISAPSDVPPTGCTISGGRSNLIEHGNALDGITDYATISGGEKNTAGNEADHAVIGGGGNNIIGPYASYASIGGGRQNAIGDLVGGGRYINNATIAGGSGNQIIPSGPGGNSGATVSGGANNIVTAYLGTIPGGKEAKATQYGQMAYASGRFANAGDAQTSTYVCRGTTTTTNLTELFLDGGGERMVIPVNSTWVFEVFFAARSSTGNSGGFQIRGTIKNNAGTTSFSGLTKFDALGSDVPAWDASVAADNVNDALRVQVNGSAGTSVRWVATVRTTEVSF